MVTMTTTTAQGSSALLTDHYELTMLRAALADGTAHHQAVFEAFARRLPQGRRYGVVAGLGRVVEAIESFTFDADAGRLAARARASSTSATADYLAALPVHRAASTRTARATSTSRTARS